MSTFRNLAHLLVCVSLQKLTENLETDGLSSHVGPQGHEAGSGWEVAALTAPKGVG